MSMLQALLPGYVALAGDGCVLASPGIPGAPVSEQGSILGEYLRMQKALREISTDSCRYPCGAYMSPRQRARQVLWVTADNVCEKHRESGEPCVEPEDEDDE